MQADSDYDRYSAKQFGMPPDGVPVLDIDPFDTSFLATPYANHERMRDAGPFVWIPKYCVLATARHEQVRSILASHEIFISGAGVGLANFRTEVPFRARSLILEADPPDHTKARALLARILSPKTVMQLRDTFAAEAEMLIDRVVARARKGEIIDGVKDLSEIYPLKVFPDAVGIPAAGRENLLLYADMIFNAFGPRNELLARAAEKLEPLTEWMMSHCRRENLAAGGFGDMIWQAADAGEITHTEAPMLVRSLLSAGIDTTVNGLGNALYCLARNPAEWKRLRADITLARPAFEEALRLESTVQTFFRTTAHATELCGIHIPANEKVLTFLGAANRDPRRWLEPERFDIGRRPAGHMAFGSGIHGCVGQVVARLEGELVLTALAKRVKAIEPAGTPTRRLNNTLRALSSLPLRLIPE